MIKFQVVVPEELQVYTQKSMSQWPVLLVWSIQALVIYLSETFFPWFEGSHFNCFLHKSMQSIPLQGWVLDYLLLDDALKLMISLGWKIQLPVILSICSHRSGGDRVLGCPNHVLIPSFFHASELCTLWTMLLPFFAFFCFCVFHNCLSISG